MKATGLAGLFLLLTLGIATAQDLPKKSGKWSGRLLLTARYGSPLPVEEEEGDTRDTLGHFRNQLAARLAYTTPKLTWSTDLQGSLR